MSEKVIITINQGMDMNGKNPKSNLTLEVDNGVTSFEDLPAGKAGTAGAAGVMSMGAGHGILETDKITASWNNGANVRYGCTAAVDGNSVTLSGGNGDALPTAGAIVLAVEVEVDVEFAGDKLKAISVSSTAADQPAAVQLLDGADAALLALKVAGNAGYLWFNGGGTNPFAGETVAKVKAASRSVSAATLMVLTGYDNIQ